MNMVRNGSRPEETALFPCLFPVLALLFVITLIAGCAAAARESRQRQAKGYQEALTRLTQKNLSRSQCLELKDCIQIALQNNLKGQAAEIQARIRKLEKNIAFANFLPSLEIKADYTAWEHQPKIKLGADVYEAMQDKEIRQTVVQAQIPIFVPAAWYLYSAYGRGAEIGDLVLDYTRQMIALQVTAMFYHCLILENAEKALQSQVKAAEALQKEFDLFQEEGLVSDWQAGQVQTLVLARRLALNHTQRARRQAKAELSGAMGLSPMADISLVGEAPLSVPDNKLEDLVLQALLNNPQLHIADRTVELQKDKIKMALSNFLPSLIGIAAFTDTSNSFVLDQKYWMGGFAGVFSVFNGFSSVNEYKAARAQKKEALVQREELCLSIMLEVIKASLNLQDVEEQRQLAQKSLDVASMHLNQIEAQWQEGLIKPSERLNAVMEMDQAQMEVMNNRFQHQVSTATLLNILGKTYMDNTDSKGEKK